MINIIKFCCVWLIHHHIFTRIYDITFHYVTMNCALCYITFRSQFAAIETTDFTTKLSSVDKIKVVDFILWHRIYQIRHREYSVSNAVFLPRFYKYWASIFAAYNQQDATFHNLFISVTRSICFRRVFRPLSAAQNCTYSVRYLSDQCC